MIWKNALKDGLPLDKQEVLISINGINYLAIYVADLNGFEVNEPKKFIPLEYPTIYWMEIPKNDH